MTVPKHEVEAIRTALRVAADAVASARAELDSATVGEDVLYGTRSNLCMALGLDLNASAIAIVDAVRAAVERAKTSETEALVRRERADALRGARDKLAAQLLSDHEASPKVHEVTRAFVRYLGQLAEEAERGGR